jgi:hypothetical protein
MMFDEFSLPELVNLAKWVLERRGEEGLINYQVFYGACGCLGPSKGELLCSCKQAVTLKTNMVEIVAQFDKDLAKRIWLAHFVKGLPG